MQNEEEEKNKRGHYTKPKGEGDWGFCPDSFAPLLAHIDVDEFSWSSLITCENAALHKAPSSVFKNQWV